MSIPSHMDFATITHVRQLLLPSLEPSPLHIDPRESPSLPSATREAPEAVGCTYLDYMGCTPFVDAGKLASVLATRSDLLSKSNVNVSSVTSLDSSLSANECLFANPHSLHPQGQRSNEVMKELRQRTVRYCCGNNAHSQKEYLCVFTSGASAGCRLVAESLGSLPWENGSNKSVVVDSFFPHRLSHNSVLGMRSPLLRQRNGGGGDAVGNEDESFYGTFFNEADLRARFERLRVHRLGRATTLPPSSPTFVTVVAFPAECNLSGTTFDVNGMSALIRRVFHEVMGAANHAAPPSALLLFCDAAAAVGKHPVDLSGSGVDFMTFSYYKAFGGPTGLGALLVRKDNTSMMTSEDAGMRHASSSKSAVTVLLQGKQHAYFGGGSVAYVLPNRQQHALKGNSEQTSGGAEGCKRKIENMTKKTTPSAASAVIDDETLCQGFEDGTPHFLGIAQALQWMRLVSLFPSLLSPSAVDERVGHLRSYAKERLSRLFYKNGAATGSDRAAVWFADSVLSADPTIASGLASSRGSSFAFRVLSSDGSPMSHSLCEELLRHNFRYNVALRAGGFCNPGGCEAFLGVTETDILETFGVVSEQTEGGVECNPSPAMPVSRCFDDNAFSKRGRAMGCLRVSFGLYSTPCDVDRLVQSLVDAFDLIERPATSSQQQTHYADGAQKEGADSSNMMSVAAAQSGVELTHAEGAATTQPMYEVHSLYVYPIKGCRPIVPSALWPAGPDGLAYDRRWCIRAVGETKALVPKMNIRLASLQPSIVVKLADGAFVPLDSVLASQRADVADPLSAAGMELYLRIDLPATKRTVFLPVPAAAEDPSGSSAAVVTVRGHAVKGATCSKATAEVNEALSAELEKPVELLHASAVGGSEQKAAGTNTVATEGLNSQSKLANKGHLTNFSNSGELLLITEESHHAVLAAIPTEEDAGHVSLQSYRPNIVVRRRSEGAVRSSSALSEPPSSFSDKSGNPQAFEELFWHSADIFNSSPQQPYTSDVAVTRLTRRELCLRCSQVGVDPSAQRTKQQPLAAIAQLSRALMASLSDEERRLLGATPHSVAFGTIFGLESIPSLPPSVVATAPCAGGHPPQTYIRIGAVVKPNRL